ncbi:unnamed protein product [Darwinula stevensoni]|uniref:Uncharacterized protein n=1 Tax=Darwinula stevensoni TaxID=69355 RepID=A0A7R8XD99_9CRUS|nr:unnamed protein product [Darwinula stevensoni]CAG0892840.1 unnamed protein product [Darwinula stevensoni]
MRVEERAPGNNPTKVVDDMIALGRSAYPESSLFRKLFWLFVFLITTGYMSYGIIDIISLYTTGKMTTSTQVNSLPQDKKFLLDASSRVDLEGIKILHCSFNEEPCREADFSLEKNEVLGNCITFNYRRDKDARHISHPEITSNNSGWDGLRLALAPYYWGTQSASITGYRLFIRKPQDITYTIDEGFNASLGEISHIGLKMVEFERIPPDQGGNCAQDTYLLQRFDPEVSHITNRTAYSKQLCQDLYASTLLMDDYNVSLDCISTLVMTHHRKILDIPEVDHGKVCYIDRRLELSFTSSPMGRHDTLFIDVLTWIKNEVAFMRKRDLKKAKFCFQPKDQMTVVHVSYETMSVEKTTEIQLYPVGRKIHKVLFAFTLKLPRKKRVSPLSWEVVELRRGVRGFAGTLHRDVIRLGFGAAGMDLGHVLVRLEEATA